MDRLSIAAEALEAGGQILMLIITFFFSLPLTVINDFAVVHRLKL